MQDIEQSWKAYIDSWAHIDSTERAKLVAFAVSDDMEFSNPLIAGRGRAELIRAMIEFQQHLPDSYFDLKSTITHHHQLLSGWTMYGDDGAELLTGHNYARFDEEGKLVHTAGFFLTSSSDSSR